LLWNIGAFGNLGSFRLTVTGSVFVIATKIYVNDIRLPQVWHWLTRRHNLETQTSVVWVQAALSLLPAQLLPYSGPLLHIGSVTLLQNVFINLCSFPALRNLMVRQDVDVPYAEEMPDTGLSRAGLIRQLGC
jgi:hypothetical protein